MFNTPDKTVIGSPMTGIQANKIDQDPYLLNSF